jgi:hypothetical protein
VRSGGAKPGGISRRRRVPCFLREVIFSRIGTHACESDRTYGTALWVDVVPGTSCQATIAPSLWDKSHSPIKGPRIKLALMGPAPKQAIGNGSLRLLIALKENPIAPRRRWVHKTANIQDKMRQRLRFLALPIQVFPDGAKAQSLLLL